jgi:hypothetical protein
VESDTIEHPPPSGLSRMLLKLPLVAHYRRVRGLSYVICWLHRLTGVALVGFCFLHVLTLQSLKNPAVYDAKMRIFSQPLFTALEWGLSFPVMFHVLNGGRLMDPREAANAERLKTLFSDQGVYRCHTSKACSHVCPKNIDVAHFIALVKQGKFAPA